jgi:peptidoglycan hydrolase-like protein with peptidoglycan-binding domain
LRVLLASVALGALAAAAVAKQPQQAATGSTNGWVAPGTPGSPITGELFHAQVLLDSAGFSPGVIDGRKGTSLTQAIKGFQEAKGLTVTGKLDNPTRQALLQQNRASTIYEKLTADEVSGPFVYPFPKKPEDRAKLQFMGYRNMLEKLAERYHTTPGTIVALNGPDKLIGPGQTLRLPNVTPSSRDYGGADKKQAQLMAMLNVDANQPSGDFIVVDKSDGTMKVYKASGQGTGSDNSSSKNENGSSKSDKTSKQGSPSVPSGTLVAQFPVTTGSSHDPLPLGIWKVTTYSFLPPFNYQPDLFWDVADDKAEQKLPPGPNGPVGVAWLDLTKEHYGIHGTNEPQTIQHTESHGCLRLTNWDVIRLSRMMKPGFTAYFVA